MSLSLVTTKFYLKRLEDWNMDIYCEFAFFLLAFPFSLLVFFSSPAPTGPFRFTFTDVR